MLIVNVCNAVQVLMFATLLRFCQAKSLKNEKSTVNSTQSQIWQPKNGTMSDWLKCYGMPEDTCQRTKNKYQHLKEMLAEIYGLDDDIVDGTKSESEETSFGQCIWLTEEQIDMLMTEAKQTEDASSARHRDKRTLINFKKTPVMKWRMPVHYKFDGTHDDTQKLTVRNAFQHWMDNTCIRFKELATDEEFDDNHILVTSQKAGCHSFTGRASMTPQPINLNEDCFEAFGVPVHEIGHSLGLWHEQMRRDRNESIRIISKNIDEGYLSEFALADNDDYGLPYNYGSVMHYSAKGASKNGKDTMIALEPLYQKNMGQRTGLSFHDTKIINLAYCEGACTIPLPQPCQRGGYQNPNKCSTCFCPDGFSGRFCGQVASAKHAKCGGVMNLTPESYEIITSPGYDTTGYTAHQECTWWIKAPKKYAVNLTFDGDFGIYCESESCFHWVEIKYKASLGLEGPRFCCGKTPDHTILSESNEMMIIFRSNFSINDRLRGFKAVVKTIYAPANRHHNQPESPKVISTEFSTTTTTTVAATTTPRTHTTSSLFHRASNNAQSVIGKPLFQCSFEEAPRADSFCEMTQDKTDPIQWKMFRGLTPTNGTGPDFPHDGKRYVYIDASSSQLPNAEARLLFPKLDFTGEVCVDFYYHMFGIHINTLQLVRSTDSKSTVVWMRSRETGKRWLHASVEVNLSNNSQLWFVGVRGYGNFGDIALDRICVKSGRCAH